MSDLEIKIERSYYSGMSIARLSLQGCLDSLTKPQLEQAIENLLSEYIYRFIIDLSSGLETTLPVPSAGPARAAAGGRQTGGSTGLGTFIKIVSKVKEKGGGVVVIKPPERLKTAFDLVGLWTYVSVADDLESALELFLPGQESGNSGDAPSYDDAMRHRVAGQARQKGGDLGQNSGSQDGNSPSQDGNLPSQDGNLPSQDGNLPSQDGNLPSQDGNLPSQDGNLPSQDGNLPSQDGNLPSQDGNLPSQDGNLPSQDGNLPSQDGNLWQQYT